MKYGHQKATTGKPLMPKTFSLRQKSKSPQLNTRAPAMKITGARKFKHGRPRP